MGLSLDGERFELRRSKTPVDVVEQRLGRDDLPRVAATHDARREVGGVAHDRVGPAVVGADVDGEGAAPVDAGAHHERALHGDRVAQDEQDPLLVALAEPGRTRDEEDLAAVGVDIGGEERHAMSDAGALRGGHHCFHRGGDGVRSLVLEQLVGATHLDEGQACDPVLAVLAAAAEVLAQHCGDAEPGDLVRDRARARDCDERCTAQDDRAVVRHPRPARVELGGGHRADEDLATLREVLQTHGGGDDRPDGEQLAVAVPDEQQVDVAGLEADRHREPHPATTGAEPAERSQRSEQALGAAGGPAGVALAGEEEEQRVAPELHQVPARLGGDCQEPPEDVVEDVGQLLGADLALSGQPLGERGEAGDVGEQDRAVDGAPAGIGSVASQSSATRARYGDSASLVVVTGTCPFVNPGGSVGFLTVCGRALCYVARTPQERPLNRPDPTENGPVRRHPNGPD